jgi:hypothetical protein
MQDVIIAQYLSHHNSPVYKPNTKKEYSPELRLLGYKSLYSLVQIEELSCLIHESESNLNTVFVNKNTKPRTRVSKHISKQFMVNRQITVKRKTPLRHGISGTYIKGINKNTRIFLEDRTKKNENFTSKLSFSQKKVNKNNQNGNSTRYRGISYGMMRQFKKRINKVKKSILFNILRNKSINLLFNSIQNYFYTKNSLLTLLKFEQHTSRLFFNLRSLIFYMSNLYNKGLIFFKFTPTMIFGT